MPVKELAGETVLIYPPKEESSLLGVLRPTGVQPGRILEIPLTEAIVDLAGAGTGVEFHATMGDVAAGGVGAGGSAPVG